MKNWIYLLVIFLFLFTDISAQYYIRGSVKNAEGEAVPRANVILRTGHTKGLTNQQGVFELTSFRKIDTLVCSALGYQTQSIPLVMTQDEQNQLAVTLQASTELLDEVEVSTGYQFIPRERATGSFTQVDQSLLNRRVSTDLLSRLEDVVPGLSLNRDSDNPNHQSNISIRGQSTISARPDPLIVIDNFPYEGNMDNINPNDVASITILKDAAAASIWGARAGNGVIVITTKKGGKNQPIKVGAIANVTIGQKRDLFYDQKMSVSDFIDLEAYLFEKGYYNTAEKSLNHAPLTPVVESLIKERDGLITSEEHKDFIASLRSKDIRNDLNRYVYRPQINQQYQVSLSGGGERQSFYLSAGLDKERQEVRGSDMYRISLNANNNYFLLKDKLEINTGLSFIETHAKDAGQLASGILSYTDNTSVIYPYATLADANGQPLPLIKEYRQDFISNATDLGLLDWSYRPLDEFNAVDKVDKESDFRVNLGAKYQLLPFLRVDALYQFQKNFGGYNLLYKEDSYFARDLINTFTQFGADGSLSYPVPMGGIFTFEDRELTGHNGRLQLNLNKAWGDVEVNAIAGYEIKDLVNASKEQRWYGYDDLHAISQDVDYLNPYGYAYSEGGSSGYIPSVKGERELSDRFVSYYSNASVAYQNKYVLSASARFDQSNLFGVKTNNKGVPLWSAGLSWDLTKEHFFHSNWVGYLRTRLTYGHSGNINRSVSAYPTARYDNGSYSDTKIPYAVISNPPNPDLRWEQVTTVNMGLDFSLLKNRISGTFEYYNKKGVNLIGPIIKPSSSGVTSFTGNFASIKGHGFDLDIQTKNLTGAFKWQTNLLYSYVQDVVTDYEGTAAMTQYLQSGTSGAYPVKDKPLRYIYSYAWAGLSPETGDPQGYFDGEVSTDYAKIIGSASLDNVVYNGSSRPTSFGAIRNTFTYKNLSLSANISYRFGYFYRRESLRYNGQIMAGKWAHADYALRWQQPGDELHTIVPSMPVYGASNITNRDNFYLNSEALVERGDHIRLQDIRLSYLVNQVPGWHALSRLEVYAYMNNIGLLWKASDADLDPDFRTRKPVRTIAFGINFNF